MFKLQDRVPRKGVRERLGLDGIISESWYYSKTGCDGMSMCCRKKTVFVHTCRYCIKTAKHSITQATPYNSTGTLIF